MGTVSPFPRCCCACSLDGEGAEALPHKPRMAPVSWEARAPAAPARLAAIETDKVGISVDGSGLRYCYQGRRLVEVCLQAEERLQRLTCLPRTLMVFWEAVFQAHLRVALFARICVDCSQLLSAAFSRAPGSLMYFRIVCRIAVCLRMPVKHGVRVVVSIELYCFSAYRADDGVCVSGSS